MRGLGLRRHHCRLLLLVPCLNQLCRFLLRRGLLLRLLLLLDSRWPGCRRRHSGRRCRRRALLLRPPLRAALAWA